MTVSTVVFGGTVTDTFAASWSGGVATFSSFCAAVAMSVDTTSCASVSRLPAPLVRPPCALVSWSSACTRTEADDSYVLGSALVSATPAPRPTPVAIRAIHQ